MTGYPRGPRGPRARMADLTEKQQEGRRNRNKGTSWMRDCVKALRLAGWTQAEIVPSHHRSDIAGVGPVAVECKDTTRWDDILQYLDQARFDAAERSRGTGRSFLPVVWKKTRGAGDPMDGLIIIGARDFWAHQAITDQERTPF